MIQKRKRGRSRTRVAAMAMTASVVAGVLAACGGTATLGQSSSGAGSQSTSNISLWLVNAGSNPPLVAAANTFDAEHPGVHINITFLPNDNAGKQKLTIAMAGNNPPSVIVSSGGGQLAQYVQAGKVEPVETALSAYPDWESGFIKSSLGDVTFNGKVYGVPILGSQPALMFYNKTIFTKLHITPPTTWDEFLADCAKIKQAGYIPLALGNSEGWPGLIWEELLVDRLGGPSVMDDIVNGDTSQWDNPAFIKANTMIQQLVKDGYFQPGYSAVDYSNGEPNALMYTNKAAMQLQLNFMYSQLQTQDASFINDGDLGWFAFPSVPGEVGNVNDEAGNVGQYAVITSQSSASVQKVAAQFLATMLPSASYTKAMIGFNEVPLTSAAGVQLSSTPSTSFTKFTYELVAKAPAYQLSWDAALPPADANTLLANLENVFVLKQTPQQFSAAMRSAG
jgi:raffinose/stachyose/melibiose transport system substrate-binding protein